MQHSWSIPDFCRGLAGPTIAAAAALFTACSGPDAREGGDGRDHGERGGAGMGTSDGAGGEDAGPTTRGERCVLLKKDIPVSKGRGTSPAIAWSGGHFGIVWTSLERDEGDITFALFDAQGGKVSETPLDSSSDPSAFPSVVPISSGFLVLWQAPSGMTSAIRARRLHADGTPAGEAVRLGSAESKEARPAGAPSGDDAVVAWTDARSSFAGLLRGSALTHETTTVGGAQVALSAAGSTFGLVSVLGQQIGVSRLSVPLRSVAPITFRQAAGKANLPRIAAHEDGSLDVAWEDDRGGEGQENIYVTRVGREGKVGPELPVPPVPGSANYPDVAVAFSRTAVAYYQFRDGPPAIFLSWIRDDFTGMEDELQVSGERPARYPRLAFSGDTLGVAYAERNGPIRLSLISCR